MVEKIFHILTCNIYNEYSEDVTSYNEYEDDPLKLCFNSISKYYEHLFFI
jgi:hypothetical protein